MQLLADAHSLVVVVSTVAALSLATPLSAQEATDDAVVLTEAEVVRRALEQNELTSLWAAQIKAGLAEESAVGAWPNPLIEYTYERALDEPDDVAEDELVLQQNLPVSGRRGLLADAARADTRALRAENRVERRQFAASLRHQFYDLLAMRDRIAIRRAWVERMRELEGKIRQRVELGESAPYDLERIRRELADVVAELSVDEAKRARGRVVLAGLVGMDEVDVAGDLAPPDVSDDEQLRALLPQHPALIAAQARVDAAQLRVEAASRWWVPKPIVTAGYKGTTIAQHRAHGFIVGIGLELPIFDRQKAARMAAAAALVRQESRQSLLARRTEARITAAARHLRELAEAIGLYRTDGVERSQNLLRIARQAYDSGEVGIVELIDAYRGWVGSQLRLVELTAEARASHIELQQNLEAFNDPDR